MPNFPAIASLIAAPIIGSFLGTVILRSARDESFATGRSHCETCSRTLTALELVPIVSFVLQRGRCRGCGARIGTFHLYVELAAILVPATALLAGADDAMLVASCLLGWILLALSWIDVLVFRLPDALTLPLILAGVGECLWLEPDALVGRTLGAAAGYTAFRLLAWSYRLLRGRDGLGEGDAKLLAAGGAWLGVSALPDIVIAAAVSGLLCAGIIRLTGRRLDSTSMLPFGPFLAAGIWLLWLSRTAAMLEQLG